MIFLEQFTYRQLQELLELVDSVEFMPGSVSLVIVRELNETQPQIWSSPGALISWLHGMKEAWN